MFKRLKCSKDLNVQEIKMFRRLKCSGDLNVQEIEMFKRFKCSRFLRAADNFCQSCQIY